MKDFNEKVKARCADQRALLTPVAAEEKKSNGIAPEKALPEVI